MRIGGGRRGRWVPEVGQTYRVEVYAGDGPSFETIDRCTVTEASTERWVVEDLNNPAEPVVIDPGQVRTVESW